MPTCIFTARPRAPAANSATSHFGLRHRSAWRSEFPSCPPFFTVPNSVSTSLWDIPLPIAPNYLLDRAELSVCSGITIQFGLFFTELPPPFPNATILYSMKPDLTKQSTIQRPRVGIPWRTTSEEQAGIREKLDYYFRAVQKAGGEPEEISLQESTGRLETHLDQLDAFVLPGSPADVDPGRYGAARSKKTKVLDPNRDITDLAILDHAFRFKKPVLAICYGCQILNVSRKGTLVQDIRSENPKALPHGSTDLPPGTVQGDLEHEATFEANSLLTKLNESSIATINSSHHQSIDHPGKKLRITAHSRDGVVEAIEWTGDANWVVGVQWHPERMVGDTFSERLFSEFVTAACSARNATVEKA
jgi:putative glutamine amidotransferase